MALRKAVGFHQDADSAWVVELSCGHRQHVRHRPPLESRPWVNSKASRQSKLGAEFECSYCDMPPLPSDARPYKQTPVFDASNVPAGLLSAHRTKPGVWGRLVVVAGLLSYRVHEPAERVWLLAPGLSGVVAPGIRHSVALAAGTRFYVEFLRQPRSDATNGR